MNTRELARRLYRIASLQQGFFTVRQAKDVGYSDSRFAYHVRVGRWTREGRGIYRLADFPPTERPDLVQWSLWSRNRKGIPQGVFSHLTALSVHGLSDIMPTQYHMTVPKGFRRAPPLPTNVVLHFASLSVDDIEEREGFRVTTPYRTIVDIVSDRGTSEEIATQAIQDGLSQGSLTQRHLTSLAELKRPKNRIRRILEQVQLL